MPILWIKALRLVFILVLCWGITPAGSAEKEDVTLKMGVVPQFDARRLRAVWEPIAQSVSEYANVTINIVGSPSIPVFEKQFMNGEFDLVYLNPYHLVKAHRAQGYQPILRDVEQLLYGIVVVQKDSPIHDVKDLDGKIIAFPAPNALGAALVPRAEFDRVYKLNFTPWYVKSHSSVYLNVLLGQAVAGGGVQQTLDKQPPEVRNELRIIYKTTELAPHPLAIHPRVPSPVRARVQTAFMALGNTPAGRALLASIPIKVIGPASIKDYEPLMKMGLEHYYVQD